MYADRGYLEFPDFIDPSGGFHAGGKYNFGPEGVSAVTRGRSNILGQSFGRLGTVVENPKIGVKMLDEGGHYLSGKINRMVPSADIIGTLKNPSVVLQQRNGRFLYLSQKAGVVINQNGKLITTYGAGNFDANILNVLKTAGH